MRHGKVHSQEWLCHKGVRHAAAGAYTARMSPIVRGRAIA